MVTVIPFPRERTYAFTTSTEYAHCINCKVRVEGTRDEGIIAVYAVGIGCVGEDITEWLVERRPEQWLDLNEELLLHIAETDQEAADAAREAHEERGI